MPAPHRHRALLLAAQHAATTAELVWLRSGQVDPGLAARVRVLASAQGQELLEEARQQGEYADDERPWVARSLATLAAAVELRRVRPILAQLLAAGIVHDQHESLPELLGRLLAGADPALPQPERERAVTTALNAHTTRWLEARMRARDVFAQQLVAAERAFAPVAVIAAQSSSAPTPAGPTLRERAEAWLSGTDDAAHDMLRWLTRGLPSARDLTWSTWFGAIRARGFDGLARPARRLYRLAEGARRLGFESELTAHLRAERSQLLLAPSARVLALNVPHDVRVIQSSLECGLLSDLAEMRAIGEALALALVSPAQSDVLRNAAGGSVSAAVGGLFQQLRADPSYLARVEAWDRDSSERAARHAAIVVLLQSRMRAALALADAEPARSDSERLEFLGSSLQRALGCPIPVGLAALAHLDDPFAGADFEAVAAGLGLHAGLRDRYDEDWYLNPRVSDVLRGACMRGNLLSAQDFAAELSVRVDFALTRLLELLA